jgi:hypothetical protein
MLVLFEKFYLHEPQPPFTPSPNPSTATSSASRKKQIPSSMFRISADSAAFDEFGGFILSELPVDKKCKHIKLYLYQEKSALSALPPSGCKIVPRGYIPRWPQHESRSGTIC